MKSNLSEREAWEWAHANKVVVTEYRNGSIAEIGGFGGSGPSPQAAINKLRDTIELAKASAPKREGREPALWTCDKCGEHPFKPWRERIVGMGCVCGGTFRRVPAKAEGATAGQDFWLCSDDMVCDDWEVRNEPPDKTDGYKRVVHVRAVSGATAGRVMELIQRERERQNAKWGVQRHNPFVWLAILTEEVGEASEAALQSGDAKFTPEFEAEMVQVAAVAVQILEHVAAERAVLPLEEGQRS